MQNRYALITITSPGYMPGTLVMLQTFFEHNPWFNGDILIYSYDLSEEDYKMLQEFPNVAFPEPDRDLVTRIEAVMKTCPKIAHKRMVFYSLHIFHILGYDKYLYIDSDAFFRGNIQELVDSTYDILFAPDGTTYSGKVKDGTTFRSIPRHPPSKNAWHKTFNAGIFFLDKKLVNQRTYKELLNLVDPSRYMHLQTLTTDQYLLNYYFREQYTELPAKYNYRLNLSKAIRLREGTTYNQAKIVHFNGGKNPWMHKHVVDAISKHHTYRLAFLDWNRAYVEFIQKLHTKAFPGNARKRQVSNPIAHIISSIKKRFS